MSYALAEARAFVAHHPGTRLELVGDVALVSIGVELDPAQLEFIAGQMDPGIRVAQAEDRFAA